MADISVEKVLDHMAMGKKVIDKVAETKSLSRGHTNRNTITNTPYILMNISHKGLIWRTKKDCGETQLAALEKKYFHLHRLR